eukprot:GDKI01044179.1.p1 GENE.GDKI01044179.1~~GDKI01044179.1.p1  ORF type:complete len:225 (-),score=68.89 GDKI01044179.1:25-699(-)
MCEITFISRSTDGLILVETWDDINNKGLQHYKTQAKQILKRLDRAPPKCSIDSGNFTFHYTVEDGVCYMTLADKNYPKKLAFAYLDEISKAFIEDLKREYGTHSVDYRSLIETIEKPYFFIKFDRVIQRKKQEYRDPRSNKAMSKLNESLAEVTQIMRQNIDDILQRGENLEDVGRKATDLRDVSKTFKDKARHLNLQALLRQYAPIAVIVLVVLVLLVWRFFR